MSILSRKKILKRILEGERKFFAEDDKKIDQIKNLDALLGTCDDKEKFKQNFNDIEKGFRDLYQDFNKKEKNTERRNKILEKIIKLDKAPEDEHIGHGLPIFIDDFNFKNLQAANYDLRLGKEVYTTADEFPKKLGQGHIGDTVRIEPGEFGVFLTHENIYIPNDLLGLISLKSTYKMKGLVNVSGFHVDPGYYGKILFSVYNAGPQDIFLRQKESVFMIMFDRLDGDPVLEGYDASKGYDAGYKNIPVDIVSSLRGAPASLKDLDKRVSSLENQRNIYGGILISVLLLIIGYLYLRGLLR